MSPGLDLGLKPPRSSVSEDSFGALGLKDFLLSDPRPTAVYELYASVLILVFENPAFERLAEQQDLKDALESWVRECGCGRERSDSIRQKHFHGREWVNTHMQRRWVVISSHSSLDGNFYHDTRPPPVTLEAPCAGLSSSGTADVPTSPRCTLAPMTSEESMPGTQLGWLHSDSHSLSPFQHFFKNYDWENTTAGPIQSWPPILTTMVYNIIAIPYPRVVFWGEDALMIYNEASVDYWSQRHPQCMGNPVIDHWPDAWPDVESMWSAVLHDGVSLHVDRCRLHMARRGFLEETCYTFLFSPIFDPDGKIVGVLDTLEERTEAVVAGRLHDTLAQLNDALSDANSMHQLWQRACAPLANRKEDLSFVAVYSASLFTEDSSNTSFSLASSTCCNVEDASLPGHCNFSAELLASDTLSKTIKKACSQNSVLLLTSDEDDVPEEFRIAVPDRCFGDENKAIALIPIRGVSGTTLVGLIIVGLSPRRPLGGYTKFLDSISDIVTKSAAIITLPEEGRRARARFEENEADLVQRLQKSTLEGQRHEDRFMRMAKDAPIGIFLYDANIRPIFLNDEYISVMGIDPAELQDPNHVFNWQDLVADEEDIDIGHEIVKGLKMGQKIIRQEFSLKKKWQYFDEVTGKTITAHRRGLSFTMPEFDESGNMISIQGWLIDVSQVKLTETLLNDRLRAANEAKRQSENFIDMTSHEMRNPLSAILQSADGILSAIGTSGKSAKPCQNISIPADAIESMIDAAETIILCAQHQKRIVDDILTLSKLDSNLLVISPDRASPPLLLQKALKMFESELVRESIDSTVRVGANFQSLGVEYVMMDSSRVLQIIINFLTNAIKFTRSGKAKNITLSLDASFDPPTNRYGKVKFVPARENRSDNPLSAEWGTGQDIYMSFCVEDTGKGLTREQMDSLFVRFQQASPKTYKEYGGSGLGLFISRELTELQGGQIGVASESGVGSCFVFFIKARVWQGDQSGTATTPVATPIPTPRVLDNVDYFDPNGPLVRQDTIESPQRLSAMKVDDPLHVLIVEDNVINQKVMAKQMRSAGAIVHVANHGAEALEFLETSIFWSSHTSPDACVPLSVVLMDLEMPVMDGMTCVRRIRDMQTAGEINEHVPVIAVTANARSEQIAATLKAGFDEVITKPFRIPQLMERARLLLGRAGKEGNGSA